MENYTICNCKNVTYFDVAEALHNCPTFSDVEKTFEEVQKITHCSTGCGGCHGKILDAISEIMDMPVLPLTTGLQAKQNFRQQWRM